MGFVAASLATKSSFSAVTELLCISQARATEFSNCCLKLIFQFHVNFGSVHFMLFALKFYVVILNYWIIKNHSIRINFDFNACNSIVGIVRMDKSIG